MQLLDIDQFDTLEEYEAYSKEAYAAVAENITRKAKMKEQLSSLETLESDADKKTAIDLLLPFVIQNIHLSKDSAKKVHLSNKLEGVEVEVASSKTGRTNKKTFEAISVEKFKKEAPALYAQLTENEGVTTLKADPKLLIVARKKSSIPAEEAAQKDQKKLVKDILESFEGRAVKVETYEEALELPVAAFKMK